MEVDESLPHFFVFCKLARQFPNVTDLLRSPLVKTHRMRIDVRNNASQKWRGHVHPGPPRGVDTGAIFSKNHKMIIKWLQIRHNFVVTSS